MARSKSGEPLLVDTHAHLAFPEYDGDRDEVIARALAAGIWQVCVGTSRETSRAAIALAERHGEGVFATVGVYPGDAADPGGDPAEEEGESAAVRELARHPKVVAIGECGLDLKGVGEGERRAVLGAQRCRLEWQIEIARELGKPLVLHCRDAYPELIAALAARPLTRAEGSGVAHFFSGTIEDAELLLDLGYDFSFGGVITFTRDYDELVAYLPLNRLLAETDAPFVAPASHRGRRNEPLYLREIVRRLAELKGLTEGEVARQTTENARRLFGI